MDWLFDKRTECWSLLTTMTIGEYINLAKGAHHSQGALSGQRDVLTTTTAKRIRERMVADLKKGALLPPIVIGAVLGDAAFDNLKPDSSVSAEEIVSEGQRSTLSIIDGMQRTSAVMEALQADPTIAGHKLRVEFWLAKTVRAMIYRMLVLNTGQVPWTMSRQLSVVYSPLVSEVQAKVPEIDKLSTPDKPGRRVKAAQYSSEDVVEMYIAFSLRKTAVDTKEAVSDEFSRLDFVDNLSREGFQDQFYESLSLLARLDKAFSRYDPEGAERFARGRNIFDAQPARIGFIVAVGTAVIGRPGTDRPTAKREQKMADITAAVERFIAKIDDLTIAELADYLRLDVLREVLDRRVGQVGRYERLVFSEAFKVMVEEDFVLDNLEQCWRAS